MKHTERRYEKSNSGHSYSQDKILQHSQKVCLNGHCGLVLCVSIFLIFFMIFFHHLNNVFSVRCKHIFYPDIFGAEFMTEKIPIKP